MECLLLCFTNYIDAVIDLYILETKLNHCLAQKVQASVCVCLFMNVYPGSQLSLTLLEVPTPAEVIALVGAPPWVIRSKQEPGGLSEAVALIEPQQP